VVKELDDLDADLTGSAALLHFAQRSGFVRMKSVDAGLTPGREQVADLLSLSRPAGNGRRRAVFEVIWVRSNAERPLPVLP
jgi:hypothetical protein